MAIPAGTAARPRPVPRAEPAARRPAPRPAPRASGRPRRRLPAVVWLLVPVMAVLLGGVVWVNVARLTLTTRTGQTVERYQAVRSEIVQLRARLAQRDGEVIDQARRRLGMVQAPSKDVTYLTLPAPARPAAAAP